MIRAFLFAKTAAVACSCILYHMKNLELRFSHEDFKKIAYKAERSEKIWPRDRGSEHVGYVVHAEENTDPQPELQ